MFLHWLFLQATFYYEEKCHCATFGAQNRICGCKPRSILTCLVELQHKARQNYGQNQTTSSSVRSNVAFQAPCCNTNTEQTIDACLHTFAKRPAQCLFMCAHPVEKKVHVGSARYRIGGDRSQSRHAKEIDEQAS